MSISSIRARQFIADGPDRILSIFTAANFGEVEQRFRLKSNKVSEEGEHFKRLPKQVFDLPKRLFISSE